MADTQTRIIARAHELAVITKRTYTIRPDRACAVHDEQPGLTTEPLRDSAGALTADTDLFGFKPAADLVINAQAHAPGGEPVDELEAGVTVGDRQLWARVVGDRTVRLRGDTISFSRPAPFSAMPLTYANAYGGVDRWARPALDAKLIDPLAPYVSASLAPASWAIYRRNAAGKGYLVQHTPEMVGLELPNVEDLDDLLTPERLVVGDPYKWHRQPLPAGFGWFDLAWFPRCVHIGYGAGRRVDAPQPTDPVIREVSLGYVEDGVFDRTDLMDAVSPRLMCGASPALIFDRLAGDEDICLHNMHPDHPELRFRLPGEKPRLSVRPLTEQHKEARPVLSTVAVDAEAGTVSLVWNGRVQCRYPHGDEQIGKVEFKVDW